MAIDSIIKRQLHLLDDTKSDIVMEVSWPTPNQDDWACGFKIRDADDTVIVEKTAHGIDALQALLLAVETARSFLTENFSDHVWQGSPTLGNTGIPRMTPAYLPTTYTENIEHYIDSQVSDFLKQVTPQKP